MENQKINEGKNESELVSGLLFAESEQEATEREQFEESEDVDGSEFDGEE